MGFNLKERDRFVFDNKTWFVSEVIFDTNTEMYRCVSDSGDDVIYYKSSLEKEYDDGKLVRVKDNE